MHDSDLIARRSAALGAGAPLFYDEPLNFVRGEGVWLYGPDGERHLDLYNNVPCVGHANPRVVAAMHSQAATLNVHSRYLHEGVVAYAERVAALHHDAIHSVVFTCSGTEASEVALQMARAATGRQGIICSDAAYHGNSTEVRKLSRVRHQSEAIPGIRAVPFPEQYRPLSTGCSQTELCDMYLARIDDAIAAFEADGHGVAALFFCSILANEGLPDIPDQYMAKAAQRVRDAGGLVIADEVQAGFCRTGQWWGYEVSGFKPDIVTMGKPMGNGIPLAGTAASTDLVGTFRDKTGYFNTFASSPLQAAVGSAVIDVIEDEQLAGNVREVGQYLRHQIQTMTVDHERVGDVRGHGLFCGIEWVKSRATGEPDPVGAERVVNSLRRKGFLIGAAGCYRNVLKLRPPLVFSRAHADSFLTALEETLHEAHG